MANKTVSACLCLFLCLNLFGQRKSRDNSESLFNNNRLNRDIVIKNTSNINSEALEFSPVLYQNGMVYVSSRFKHGAIDESIGETFFELYYAEMDRNGMPGKPETFSVEINSQVHEGPVSFNKDGDRMYFTRSNLDNGLTKSDSKGKVGLKIYEAQKGYFDWENVRALSFNSDEYSCVHPSLSADGKRLYFASNMPGGYGCMDLYVVQKLGGAWSKPINLGPEINTDKNEVFPFIHDSNVLFFSSDGHRGIGGLDLFMIDLSQRKWGNIINLGRPFNSPNDDLGLVLDENGTIGYFASDREGGFGKDDVYMFEAPDGIQGISLPTEMNTNIVVYDASTSKRSSDAAIRIFERSKDGLIDNEDLYNVELLPSEDGSGELVMKMVRKKEDELGEAKIFTDSEGEANTRLVAGKDFLVLVSKPGYKTTEIVYSTKNSISNDIIEVALEPSNCLNLNGIVVSENFSRRVANALIRVVNECNGAEELIRTNFFGEFETCLQIGCDFTVIAEKEGYSKGNTKVSTVKIRGSRSISAEIALTPIMGAEIKEPLQEGTIILLENIYYDFNKSAIRSGAARDLEALVKLMDIYPTMEVELGAHTDSRGTEEYNLKLSLKRAESAKRFLVRKGISPNRIKSFGYGEAKLRNYCDDGVECTEEEHQYNRRTEVRITRFDEQMKSELIGNGMDRN
jgi:outer membrane protein OmpA-like peptidoglycan-associated protein